MSDIEDLGHSSAKILLETDQEHAIVDLQNKIMAARGGETVPKHSPVGESQSNGEVGNRMKMFQEQFRTLNNHLEASTKLDVSMGHAVIPWLLQWTSATLNRYVAHKNGMTSYQRTTGKKSTRTAATFGDKVLHTPLKTERLKR